MMNPFETTGQTSSVKRNMSILMDPLSSAPHYSGPQISSPSRHPGNLGSQIPRNPSPLVNSCKPPKQENEPPANEVSQPVQQNSSTKRTTLKDGMFILKPNKNYSTTANRNIQNDNNTGTTTASMLPTTENGNNAGSANEQNGSKDAPPIALSFRTFYSNNGDANLEDQSKGESSPKNSLARTAQDATIQNSGKIPIFKTSQGYSKPSDSVRADSDLPATKEPSQHNIISPVPSRTDIESRRGSSGVYSLLNREGSAPASPMGESSSNKKIKL